MNNLTVYQGIYCNGFFKRFNISDGSAMLSECITWPVFPIFWSFHANQTKLKKGQRASNFPV